MVSLSIEWMVKVVLVEFTFRIIITVYGMVELNI